VLSPSCSYAELSRSLLSLDNCHVVKVLLGNLVATSLSFSLSLSLVIRLYFVRNKPPGVVRRILSTLQPYLALTGNTLGKESRSNPMQCISCKNLGSYELGLTAPDPLL